MLFKKTQAELDTAFLNAAGEYKFKKAKSLLAKGANVLAVDSEGNTALHQLAKGNPDSGDCHESYSRPNLNIADSFICFLVDQKVEMNASNNLGHTCLHLAAANRSDEIRRLVGILMNRGADPNIPDCEGKTPLHYNITTSICPALSGAHINVRDNAGRTPLHTAAFYGRQELADYYLQWWPAAVRVQDNEGNYPHDLAVIGLNHDLARKLKKEFEEFQEKKVPAKAKAETKIKTSEKLPKVVPDLNDAWVLLAPEKVEHTEVTSAYRITELFNFHARTYTQITHNLETKQDVPTLKSFDDFGDKTILQEAHAELKRLGGKADESRIESQSLSGKSVVSIKPQ